MCVRRRLQEKVEAIRVDYPDLKLEETGPRRSNSTLWVGNVRGNREKERESYSDMCLFVFGFPCFSKQHTYMEDCTFFAL